MSRRLPAASALATALLSVAALSPDGFAGDPITRMFTPDGESGDNLGYALAMDGTRVVVGIPRDGAMGTQAGSAAVFDSETGALLSEFLAFDAEPFDMLGSAVALDGTTAVIGAPNDDDFGPGSGSAYVVDALTGAPSIKLFPTPFPLDAGDRFGWSVDADGGLAVVGAPGDDDQGDGAGAVYVIDTLFGATLFKLTASDGAPSDLFGNSVAIDGDTILVGAPGLLSNRGAVYQFDATTGAQIRRYDSPQSGGLVVFGRSVDVSGDRAVIGAPFADAGVGAAWLYDVTTGATLAKLAPSDGEPDDRIGEDVAIGPGLALVGSWPHDAFGDAAGAAWAFDPDDGSELGRLSAHDAAANRRFGHALAVSGDRVVVSAVSGQGAALNTGSVYGYDLSAPFWSNLAGGRPGVAGPPSLHGLGDMSPGSDLCLAVGDAAPEQQGFLVLGLTGLAAPFKGGTLVPSPDLILGGFATDADGRVSITASFPPAGVLPGLDVHAQVWVQDGSVFPPYSATNGVVRTTP